MCAMGGHGSQELPDGPKIREPTFLEGLCQMGHLFDTMLTGYALRLRTPRRITREEMLKAMFHLRRQVPCLRMAFSGTGRDMWIQEASSENLDLEMVEHDSVDEVMAVMSRYRYVSRTGPLWCVKVLVGYPPNRAPVMPAENLPRPDTGLGTPSPEDQDQQPRPGDDGFGCEPLMPGDIIAVPLNNPHRCFILPPAAPGQDVQYNPMMPEGQVQDAFPPYAPNYIPPPDGVPHPDGIQPPDSAPPPNYDPDYAPPLNYDPDYAVAYSEERADAVFHGEEEVEAVDYREGSPAPAPALDYMDEGGAVGYDGQHQYYHQQQEQEQQLHIQQHLHLQQLQIDDEEEAYGSGSGNGNGSGSGSGRDRDGARMSPTNDSPDLFPEEVDPYRPDRPMVDAQAREPRPPPASNISAPAAVPRVRHMSGQAFPPLAARAQAGAIKTREEKRHGSVQGEVDTEQRKAAGSAMAPATAVPKELGSARSSFIGTSNSGSPAFMDTTPSSLSSSPPRGISHVAGQASTAGGGAVSSSNDLGGGAAVGAGAGAGAGAVVTTVGGDVGGSVVSNPVGDTIGGAVSLDSPVGESAGGNVGAVAADDPITSSVNPLGEAIGGSVIPGCESVSGSGSSENPFGENIGSGSSDNPIGEAVGSSGNSDNPVGEGVGCSANSDNPVGEAVGGSAAISDNQVGEAIGGSVSPLGDVGNVALAQVDDGSFDGITNVVVGFHQGIADGHTAMRILGRLVKLLNDVIMDVEIEDSVPLEGNLEDLYKELLQPRIELLRDVNLHEMMFEKMRAREKWESCMKCVFGEIAGGGGGGRRPHYYPCYHVLSLDAATTTLFLEKCVNENVGLRAAFSAIVNISLMDILTARDVIKDTYKFFSSHAINIRRFSNSLNDKDVNGCLFAPVHIRTPTPRHAADNFWEFVRRIHYDLNEVLDTDQALKELAVMELNPPGQREYDMLFMEPLPQMKDYFTCLLGDITEKLTDNQGPNVMVEFVEATMSRHKLGYACCHVLHIFQESLCITLNYSTRYLTEELGKEYMSNIYRRLYEVI